MDARTNPYAPGAGTPPPELAGRDDLIEDSAVALDRIRNGLAAKSLLMVGLRGVGKTVLLNRICRDAECRGFTALLLEAPEDRSLPGLLAAPLHSALVKMSRRAAAGDAAKRALSALAGFVQAMKVNFGDISIGIDIEGEPGIADSGHLDFDLSDLLTAVGEAAQSQNTAVALFIDELQYVEEKQLAALIVALHRSAQRQLPVTLVGAGLPQLVAHAAAAKTYAERLFSFPEIGALSEDAARYALEAPAKERNVAFHPDALSDIVRHTQCYPYFLQEWGKHSWDCAEASQITAQDVTTATAQATAELDASFFRARFDRLAPSEKRYLRAMAELGPGPHRSGEISRILAKGVGTVAPTRAKLIEKGMIYSPAHGDTGFTVPLFDEYLRRVLPRLPPA
ncbi:MAG: ATP-binding protein [Gammaproteobacteria bacterium]|nr:ATP-binding protein [Gammaproteobacteria bacterium]MYE84689.1 ATP-binding protein [Gammaproteobacteria bacterium]